MSLHGNATLCPPDRVPDIYGFVPRGFAYAVAPATDDATVAAVAACCAPRPVNLAERCALWCQLPGGDDDASEPQLLHDFSRCLRHHNATNTIAGVHSAAAAPHRTGRAAAFVLALWALAWLGAGTGVW